MNEIINRRNVRFFSARRLCLFRPDSPHSRILARPPKVASKMAFNGFPFGGFTMGATGPDGMDVSLDDMIKKVRLSFSALATRKRQLKRSFQELSLIHI